MVQKYVDKALTNPLFHAGINLLSIDDARQGPKAALQGLLAGKEVQQQMAQQKQAQAEAERKKAALAALGQQMPGLQPYIGTGLEGQAMTMLGQQAKQPKYRQLSPEESAALGLPKGGVYQQDQSGKIVELYKPPASQLSGNPGIVGSPFKLGSGNMGFLREDGTVVDTGTPFHSAPNTFEAGGIRYTINPITGQAQALVSPETVAGTESEIKGRGELSQAISSGSQTLDVIRKARMHPGREAATGGSSLFNPLAIPGGERRDFLTIQDQLKGKAFLQGFQSLKGGGTITEIEGLKAEQAIARLDTAQSEDAYLDALNDLEQVVTKGMVNAYQKANEPVPSDIAPTITTQSGYDALESGTLYIEDDGKLYRKP